LVVHHVKGLVRALAALDLGQLAHARHELVPARRGITMSVGLLAEKTCGIDIRAAAEERSKEAHLIGRCRWDRRGWNPRERHPAWRGGIGLKVVSESGETLSCLSALLAKPSEVRLFFGDSREQVVS
jgi:hypothetical protein